MSVVGTMKISFWNKLSWNGKAEEWASYLKPCFSSRFKTGAEKYKKIDRFEQQKVHGTGMFPLRDFFPLFQPFPLHFIATLVKNCGGSIRARWTGSVSNFSLFMAGRKCFRIPAVLSGERGQVDWSKSSYNHRHCERESYRRKSVTSFGLFICFYQMMYKKKFVGGEKSNFFFI